MKIKSILSALLLMVSSMASAQYLNVKLEDGSVRSFKTTPNMKVSFGDKAGAEVTESAQIITVGGHTVTVKLADNTPVIAVMSSVYVENGDVKIKVSSAMNVALKCTRNDNVEVSAPEILNGFQIFTISNISRDVVATIEYASWDEDNIINGHPCVRLAGLYWATENVSSEKFGAKHHENYGDYFPQSSNNALDAAKSWDQEGNFKWTLPKSEQWSALIKYCDCTHVSDYPYKDKKLTGLLIKGRKENGEEGNSMFLPAAGQFALDFQDIGVIGYYWSYDSGEMFCFGGVNNYGRISSAAQQAVPRSVRPIAVMQGE